MEKLLGIDTTGYFIEQVYTLFKEVIISILADITSRWRDSKYDYN